MNTDDSRHHANYKLASSYIGRFAPSPTGPLHFGSLIAATASYLNTKIHKNGKWLLRIEDVDTQRIQKDATKSIIHTLESYGFEWHGDIIYQSQRGEIYQAALDSISKHTYSCSCTRKSLTALTNNYSYIYPGLCRKYPDNPEAVNLSIRVLTDEKPVCFNDKGQNIELCQNINKEVGDFILKRSDGLYAYQLAVVVDDALQEITEVVRGADLFDNTPRQIYLQGLLGFKHPEYLHFPVAVDNYGKKLSKQNLSPKISIDQKYDTLIAALNFLGQKTLKTKEFSSLDDLWNWAVQNWDPAKIPKVLKKNHE